MTLPEGTAGFVLYTLALVSAALLLPSIALDSVSHHVAYSIGILALWRYSWGAINFIRGNLYNRLVFPRWRRDVTTREKFLLPPKIYLLLTIYRVNPETSLMAIHAAIKEAIHCGLPVSIIASIVEFADEMLIREVFTSLNPPEHVTLTLIRIPGTGKRDALAQGFRAISRDMPPLGSVVAVIDGDSILTPGLLRRCVPFFARSRNLGALTTDELCNVHGSPLFRAWHNLRFAQRHILMGSMALSKRVMTLTGRMSMFRADIVTDPDFIRHMSEDYLDHWRLGRFRFLTGDDKSSLYWVLKNGYDQIYVPDVHIVTIEEPLAKFFVVSSTRLMLRWFGNMLRTNTRVLKLGPHKMPLFIWWSFLDQRLSMWTTLAGPLFALMLAAQEGPVILLYYVVWVAFTRWAMTLTLLSARPSLNWRYPLLLYYNQIYGSLVKTWVLFRLDRQSWTRQKTSLERGLSVGELRWMEAGSAALHTIAFLVFIGAVGLASSYFAWPRLLTP